MIWHWEHLACRNVCPQRLKKAASSNYSRLYLFENKLKHSQQKTGNKVNFKSDKYKNLATVRRKSKTGLSLTVQEASMTNAPNQSAAMLDNISKVVVTPIIKLIELLPFTAFLQPLWSMLLTSHHLTIHMHHVQSIKGSSIYNIHKKIRFFTPLPLSTCADYNMTVIYLKLYY